MTEISEEPLASVLGSAAQGQLVTIAIGPEKIPYHIHKDVICHHSEYFRTAYNGRWKEAEEGVTLEDVEIEVFNFFVHWLYTQQLPALRYFHDATDSNGLLLKTCVFGDRFLAPVFRRLVHNEYADKIWKSGGAPYQHIIWAFKHLADDDLLLALMVDVQCIQWKAENDTWEQKDLLPLLPQEFLLRVMFKYEELVAEGNVDREILDACSYHLHASDAERKACQEE